jgi:hypothetical protein
MLAYALAYLKVTVKNHWLVEMTKPLPSHWFTGQYMHGRLSHLRMGALESTKRS